MKIGVFVHLYHIDMLDSIKSYLDNLKYEYDLFFSITKNYPQSFLTRLKNINKNTQVHIVKNVGMDIGGFLQVYKKENKEYDLILKIHTKKGLGSPSNPSLHTIRHGLENSIKRGEDWFYGLMNGVLENEKKVKKIIKEFEINTECGMVGSKVNNNFSKNINFMNKIFSFMGVESSLENHLFVGGTIFWVRGEILKKYLSDYVIDKILEESPEGYVHEPSINHAMERVFGSLVYLENKKLFIIK
jgi:lipopolysaccharide biosynthesis protein